MIRKGLKKNVVIVSAKKGELFTGEMDFYKDLINSIEEHGGTGCVFPLSTRNRSLSVYYWDNSKGDWIEKPHPRPHIIYNRYPYRHLENSKEVRAYFKKLKSQGIKFFNDSFFNKKDISELMGRDDILKHYYPTTVPLTNEGVLWSFLSKYPVIYIKDTHGSQGKGIWKIEKNGNKYQLFSQRKIFQDLSFPQLHYLLKDVYKSRDLLNQRCISITKINDTPYDFRVLMHHINGKWIFIGIGARGANEDGYTTHVPQGGKVLDMDEVPVKPEEDLVSHLGQQIGNLLESHYTVKEFSFDVGIDMNKNVWVLDINSKPMSFDERHIQKKRIDNLTKIFLHES
ncbi:MULTISPECIES: YheC/YheD family protein [Bacillaceae]|uniref:YheC/YheD family protein n=1 Tax=Evansella alkalicola TaxID=745819 RepID=A0ABS6JQB1_9BACI|nr:MULTISPECIES: YheC/YheD family protein [Bacillaceae]MBU9720743.1 YheC/YheD family protein [Bacillus alkalicola]